MEANTLCDNIQRKIWSIDEITIKAKLLVEQARQMPKECKSAIPKFNGDWSEENIQRFFRTFEESIVSPIRHRNRDLIANMGIETKQIPDSVFDDSVNAQEIVMYCSDIKISNEIIFKILIDKGILGSWVKEGLNVAAENLKKAKETKQIFEEVLKSSIGKELKEELLQRSLSDPTFLGSTEDFLDKTKYAQGFGISIEKLVDLELSIKIVREICQKIIDLDKFSISRDEIAAIVHEQPISNVSQLLAKTFERYAEKEKWLVQEWEMYAATLRSIGQFAGDRPDGIRELENGVKSLKTECSNALGESGMNLLSFLKGDAKFPEEVSIDQIKKALEVLRPVFIKFLTEESQIA